MRRVLVLGSTGSIGVQALEVIAANPGRFELVGLAAGRDREKLAAQAAATGVTRTALGADEAVALIRETVPDVVLNGITGSVGLAPTLAALEVGSPKTCCPSPSLPMMLPGSIVGVDRTLSSVAVTVNVCAMTLTLRQSWEELRWRPAAHHSVRRQVSRGLCFRRP